MTENEEGVKMILDKNGKIGGKVSIIDLFILLIVLVVIAGIGMRYGSRITSAVKSDAEFEYVVMVEGIRQC